MAGYWVASKAVAKAATKEPKMAVWKVESWADPTVETRAALKGGKLVAQTEPGSAVYSAVRMDPL